MPNYLNNWRRLGFTDDDFVGQGSDRLVDALVAWGYVETIGKRVKDLDAGADHVCIQVFDVEPRRLPSRQWRMLATRVVVVGHALVQNVRRGHYELAVEEPARRRVAVAFDELTMAI